MWYARGRRQSKEREREGEEARLGANAAHFIGTNMSKTLHVHAPHADMKFSIMLYPGTGEKALFRALASRVRLPITYHDGSDTFFLTDGAAPDDMLVPLCADGLPDGKTLYLHVNAPPPPTSLAAADDMSLPPAPVVTSPVTSSDTVQLGASTAAAAASDGAPAGALPPAAMGPAAASPVPKIVLSVAAARMQRAYRALKGRRNVQNLVAEQRSKRSREGALYVCVADMVTFLVVKFRLQKWIPGFVSPYDRISDRNDQDHLYGMERMARLGTDLANERTLLAWIRTVLAIMRTAFATLGLEGVNAAWAVVQTTAVMMMTLLMCVAAYVGIYRFYRINRIVSLKHIPSSFGKNRVPIWPLTGTFVLSLVTVTIAMLAQGFEK